MIDDDSNYHWAYVAIISTKTDFELKRTLLATTERRWKRLSNNITEATTVSRKLTENPCIAVDTVNNIHDRFTMFFNEANEYLQAVYEDINLLRNTEDAQEEHHDSPARSVTPASSSTDAAAVRLSDHHF